MHARNCKPGLKPARIGAFRPMEYPMRALVLLFALLGLAQAQTVEEARLARAELAMPEVRAAFQGLERDFAHDWQRTTSAGEATQLARETGRRLWLGARARLQQLADYDDRPLYWSRLALSRTVRDTAPGFAISPAQRAAALAALELASRGQDELQFAARSAQKRVLITGFDPFLLERNLNQSNPSGVAALWLDGRELILDGQRIRIEAAVFPVRYADFDAGAVERFLRPWLGQIDLLATISMGRQDFDLERFPGRRRSANVVDNQDLLPGASRQDPQPPKLDGQPLNGPEFVEFSLPVAAMQRAQGPYRIIDNRWVRVLPDTRLEAPSLAALAGQIAVEGGGGGYLSNEISYRAVRLRDELGLRQLPVGHIHTPAIAAFEPDKTRDIVTQIEAMLRAALQPG